MIADAVAAAAREDWAACLSALLAAWRPKREPELAELIDRVSAHIAVPAVRPDMKAIAARITKASDTDVTAIMTALASKVLTHPPAMQLGLDLARVRDPDPRIATLLATFAPFRNVANPLDLAAIEALDAIDDPRYRYLITKCAEALGPRRDRLTRDRARIDAVVAIAARLAARRAPQISAAVNTAIKAIDRALARPTPASMDAGDRATLLAAIYSRPDDTSTRLVYADVLQDMGDPRGEFITLQCARAPDARPSRRENELRKTHEQLWLDGLEPYLFKQDLAYRRGFLAEARLAVSAFTTAPAELAWHTLEALDVTECSGPILAGWLPTLRGLRRVRRVHEDDVQFIAAHGPVAWTELALLYPSDASLALLGQHAAKFPNLRTLDLTASTSIDVRAIAELAPLHLDRLRIGVGIALHAVHDRLATQWVPRLFSANAGGMLPLYVAAAQRIGIRALELVPIDVASVTITGTHATVEITAKASRDYVRLILEALPIGLIRTLSSNRPLPELAAVLEARQITLVASPGASSRGA